MADDSVTGEITEAISTRKPWSRKRKGLVIVIAIFIVFIFFISWGNPLNLIFRTVSYDYQVEVRTNSTAPYTLILPMPVNEYGKPYSNMLDELRISDSANKSLRISETQYGSGIEINGTGNLSIHWIAEWYPLKLFSTSSPDDFSKLSLVTESHQMSNDTAMVFSDVSDIGIGLKYDFDNVFGNLGALFEESTIDANLTAGWNALHMLTWVAVA